MSVPVLLRHCIINSTSLIIQHNIAVSGGSINRVNSALNEISSSLYIYDHEQDFQLYSIGACFALSGNHTLCLSLYIILSQGRININDSGRYLLSR